MVVWTRVVSGFNLPYEATQDSLAYIRLWKDCSDRSQGNGLVDNSHAILHFTIFLSHWTNIFIPISLGERWNLHGIWKHISGAYWIPKKPTMVWTWLYFNIGIGYACHNHCIRVITISQNIIPILFVLLSSISCQIIVGYRCKLWFFNRKMKHFM